MVNRDDINALHKAIDSILANGKQYYLNACRNRAVQNYNKNERFRDYLNLYSELLRKHTNTGY